MPAPESEMRQQAKDLLIEIASEFDGYDVDLLVKALAAAHARGKAEGLEEAAKIVARSELFCADERGLRKQIAAAIRSRQRFANQ